MKRVMLVLALVVMAGLPAIGKDASRPFLFIHSPGPTCARTYSSVALGGFHLSPLQVGHFRAGMGMIFDGKQGADPGRWPGFLIIPASYRLTRLDRSDEWDATISYARGPHVAGSAMIFGISYGLSRKD